MTQQSRFHRSPEGSEQVDQSQPVKRENHWMKMKEGGEKGGLGFGSGLWTLTPTMIPLDPVPATSIYDVTTAAAVNVD